MMALAICSAQAQETIVGKQQILIGPAGTPTTSPPALEISGLNPIAIDDRGEVIAPDGRAIFAHETGLGAILVTGNGVAFGDGSLCPGGSANFARAAANGLTGCSGIRAQNVNSQNSSPLTVHWGGTVKGTSAGINELNAGSGKDSVIANSGATITGVYEFGIEVENTGDANTHIAIHNGASVQSAGEGILISDANGGDVLIQNRGHIVAGTTPFNGVTNSKISTGTIAAISVLSDLMVQILNVGTIESTNHGFAIQTTSWETAIFNAGGLIKGAILTPGKIINSGTWKADKNYSRDGSLTLDADSHLVTRAISRIDESGEAELAGTLRITAGNHMRNGWHDVLSASSIIGKFASIVSPMLAIEAIRYTPTEVLVKLDKPSPMVESQDDCLRDPACAHVGMSSSRGGANPVPGRPINEEELWLR